MEAVSAVLRAVHDEGHVGYVTGASFLAGLRDVFIGSAFVVQLSHGQDGPESGHHVGPQHYGCHGPPAVHGRAPSEAL